MGERSTQDRVEETLETSQHDRSHEADLEKVASISSGNLVYNDVDEEPAIHLRTWIALASMFLMNFVQTFALQGPPSVVSTNAASL